MLKVLKNRTLEELINCFYTSKKRAATYAEEDATSSYAEMAPLIASNETNSYMKQVIKDGDSVLAIAGAFDHLSNIHNFMSETFTCNKLRVLHDKLKPGAKVIIYCMGMRKCWFDIAKKGGTILPMDDLNWEFMNEQIFISVQSQIVATMNIYQSMLELFDSVEVIEVKTSKGMVMYNTGTDCVMVLTK